MKLALNQTFIKEAALSVGFNACGIAKAEELTEDAAFLKQWLAAGYHAGMNYLERNFEKRVDPRNLVPGCKSVVVVLLNYFPAHTQNTKAPQLAKYAYSAIDYHLVIKQKLKELELIICEKFGNETVANNTQHLFVDSAPVLERRWAERAGLGWIGKHTQLIHPGLGSYVFIGILLLNIEAEYDQPIRGRCGTCSRCITACPTKALTTKNLDANRCISYQTIENKNQIPDEMRSSLNNYSIGCDICADVCPWNKKWAKVNSHSQLNPPLEVLNWDSKKWEQLSEKTFNSVFQQSAIKRAGFAKLKQNIEILVSTSNLEL